MRRVGAARAKRSPLPTLPFLPLSETEHMLTREDNEMLTRVGKGTPMGAFFRKYWLPVGISADQANIHPCVGRGSRSLPRQERHHRAARRALRAPAGQPLPRDGDEQGPDVPLSR